MAQQRPGIPVTPHRSAPFADVTIYHEADVAEASQASRARVPRPPPGRPAAAPQRPSFPTRCRSMLSSARPRALRGARVKGSSPDDVTSENAVRQSFSLRNAGRPGGDPDAASLAPLRRRGQRYPILVSWCVNVSYILVQD